MKEEEEIDFAINNLKLLGFDLETSNDVSYKPLPARWQKKVLVRSAVEPNDVVWEHVQYQGREYRLAHTRNIRCVVARSDAASDAASVRSLDLALFRNKRINCFSFRPHDRFSSVRSLIQSLRRSSDPSPHTPRPARSSSLHSWLISVVVLGLVVLCLCALQCTYQFVVWGQHTSTIGADLLVSIDWLAQFKYLPSTGAALILVAIAAGIGTARFLTFAFFVPQMNGVARYWSVENPDWLPLHFVRILLTAVI